MTTKRILVLANSIKHAPSRCVAGREVLVGTDRCEMGSWIRPVSLHGDGELCPRETRLFGGYQPQVMDILEIPLARPCCDPRQPENWTIAISPRWKKIGLPYYGPALGECVEAPRDLWLQPNQRTDRVSAEYLRSHRARQSLWLIRVDRVRICFSWNPWDGSKKRRRASFSYRGVTYTLALTDPVFEDRHRAKFPLPGRPSVEFEIASPGGCFLCVSLAREYHGVHYKVVATILEAREHQKPWRTPS